MALLAGTVITEIKGILNDPTGSIYPDQAIIPLLNKAYRELQTKLAALGVSVTKEVSGTVVLPETLTYLADGSGLPPDLIYPIQLGERNVGSSEKFAPMEEREWDPDIQPASALRYWVWREESLRFVGATLAKQLLVRYVKSLPSVSDINSPISINDSQTYLAQRAGSLCSLLIGHNPSRAEALNVDLFSPNGAWEDLKATKIKRMQNIPVRRRRTRWRIR